MVCFDAINNNDTVQVVSGYDQNVRFQLTAGPCRFHYGVVCIGSGSAAFEPDPLGINMHSVKLHLLGKVFQPT